MERLRPVLYPGLPEVKEREEHVSHAICREAQQLIDETDGLVLNLSAGGTAAWHPQVVEVETAIFRNTDVVADVHSLPFVDGAFAGVIALNAFEHFRNPFQAAAEIARVLAPGGRLLIHTAFLQPLHEAPWHYFNATKHGVLEWFPQFTTETIRVSPNFNPFFTVGWLAHELGVRMHAHLTAEEANLVTGLTLAEIAAIWGSPDRWQHPVWRAFERLPQEAQEGIAAGFEFVGRRR
jgi:SAM-dependent methyltransferase